jgi:uncharacterized protein with PIN domain
MNKNIRFRQLLNEEKNIEKQVCSMCAGPLISLVLKEEDMGILKITKMLECSICHTCVYPLEEKL